MMEKESLWSTQSDCSTSADSSDSQASPVSRVGWQRDSKTSGASSQQYSAGNLKDPEWTTRELLSEANGNYIANDVTKIRLLRLLFGRTRSKLASIFSSLYIPTFMRGTIFRLMLQIAGTHPDDFSRLLEDYKTFYEFFSRSLSPGARPIEDADCNSITSPVDGTIASFTELCQNEQRAEQVKGSTYDLRRLCCSQKEKVARDGNSWYSIVLYLSPSDYHKFHAPMDFKVDCVKQVEKEKFPVFPGLVARLNDLFCLNTRTIISGTTQFGQLDYVAVAAYNVGDIVDYIPKDFVSATSINDTTCKVAKKGKIISPGQILNFRARSEKPYAKGDLLGEFRLGSTVVMVFEAPSGLQLTHPVGDRVRVGEPLLAA